MYVFVSEAISGDLYRRLEQNYRVITIGPDARLYPSIASHPDIRILPVDQHVFIDAKTFQQVKRGQKMKAKDLEHVTVLDVPLKATYPDTVFLNASYKDGVFIHHRTYTHPLVKAHLLDKKIRYIHTNQGYTRCSLLQLDHQHAVTSDEGMARQLAQEGMQILKIEPGHIYLEGQAYGFIGGASGVIGRTVYFNGNLKLHPDYYKIKTFIEKLGFDILDCSDRELTDIGSILFWEGPSDDHT